jgi:hypothetical protein
MRRLEDVTSDMTNPFLTQVRQIASRFSDRMHSFLLALASATAAQLVATVGRNRLPKFAQVVFNEVGHTIQPGFAFGLLMCMLCWLLVRQVAQEMNKMSFAVRGHLGPLRVSSLSLQKPWSCLGQPLSACRRLLMGAVACPMQASLHLVAVPQLAEQVCSQLPRETARNCFKPAASINVRCVTVFVQFVLLPQFIQPMFNGLRIETDTPFGILFQL